MKFNIVESAHSSREGSAIYKILICGGRHFDNYDIFECLVSQFLQTHHISTSNIEIVSGHCKGVDMLGERFANEYDIPVKVFPAKWSAYGKAAGPIRNKEMLNYLSADVEHSIILAFWSGKSKGTKFTVETGRKMGIAVQEFIYELIGDRFILQEGVSLNGNSFVFDFCQDSKEDIIDIDKTYIRSTKFAGSNFFYEYKFNTTATAEDRKRFLKYVKSEIPNEVLQELIAKCVEDFCEKISKIHFDAIVALPSTKRINNMIVDSLKSALGEIPTLSLSKLLPSEIEFDWNLFSQRFKFDDEYKQKIVAYIQKILASATSNDYFSISKIPGKYRQYIKPFVKIEGDIPIKGNLLIVDDIMTSGNSIGSTIKAIRNKGFVGDVYILTLIRNR